VALWYISPNLASCCEKNFESLTRMAFAKVAIFKGKTIVFHFSCFVSSSSFLPFPQLAEKSLLSLNQ
jgi:hypothetical protein